MFGFDIVGSFLSSLFEAFLSHFHPGKKDNNYHSLSAPQLQIIRWTHLFTQLKFTISPCKRKTRKNNNSSLDRPDYGHVEFEHNDLGLSNGQSSYSEMTHWFTTAWREPAVSLLIYAFQKTK